MVTITKMTNFAEEMKKAKEDYNLAIQQENNADPAYIDIAISNTNAALIRLNNIIRRAKLEDPKVHEYLDDIEVLDLDNIDLD